jgi:hypothetical protein
MSLWSSLLRNPKSRLNGFDSFEGLPEIWILARSRDTLLSAERFRCSRTPG